MKDPLENAVSKVTSEFEASVSSQRFNWYMSACPNKLDAIAVYLWNISLCSALYPTLQCLEITYRNALNNALQVHKGTANWLDDKTLMLSQEQNSILQAKRKLGQGQPANSSWIVAELSFGFWVAIYSGPYTNTIVHATMLAVFPHVPKRQRNPQNLLKRLQEARKLRNRIFHHEPIWHWVNPLSSSSPKPSLMQQYEDILDLTRWIGTGKMRLTEQIDAFRQVHDDGWQPFRSQVDQAVLEEALVIENAQKLNP